MALLTVNNKPLTIHSVYKAFWIVVIGAVIGYIVEVFYCMIIHGTLESRQGLIYGPFSQIYGVGALLLVIVTLPIKKRGNKWIFFTCAIGGGVLEYICSWGQEYFFGVQTWNYQSPFALSISGRSSLTYMIFRGALGVFFINYVYPKIALFIERILNSRGVLLTWLLAIFLLVDIVISIVAVSRWTERQIGEPAEHQYEIFIDAVYPDEFMSDIFPQMELLINE